jgi:hypothetical protein
LVLCVSIHHYLIWLGLMLGLFYCFLRFLHSKSFVPLPVMDWNADSKYPLNELTVSISYHFTTSRSGFWSLTWFMIFSVTFRSFFWSLTWFNIFSVTYDTRDEYIGYSLSDQECNSTVFLFLVSLWTCDINGHIYQIPSHWPGIQLCIHLILVIWSCEVWRLLQTCSLFQKDCIHFPVSRYFCPAHAYWPLFV